VTPAAFGERYRAHFGARPRIYVAPGRVNLIGEHTDYNDGLVMPLALPFVTMVGGTASIGTRCRVDSLPMNETCEIDLAEIVRAEHKPRAAHWSNYVAGVLQSLARLGVALRPMNLLIDTTVPIGAGLSSSAALEVATALTAIGVADACLDARQIALACQRAENDYVGVRCGIMDQFAALFGEEDRVLFIDCRTLEHATVPLDHVAVVVCNTRVRHSLAGSEYNQRRAQCEEAVRHFAALRPGVASLRDVTVQDLAAARDSIGELLYRRCRHVISENSRVSTMREALAVGDLDRAGSLLRESHVSLRDDFEVSCVELDVMVDVASAISGVYGSRMTGGGFGGCTVNLVERSAVSSFVDEVTHRYAHATDIRPEIYVCRPSKGAHEVTDWS
jgi:galactokinase